MIWRHQSDKHDSAPPYDPVEHLPQLDGLRGVAILLVLVYHFNQFIGHKSAFASVYLPITGWGWIGVELFFVLSGFLITTILWRYRFSPSYFIAFYGRRFLRIFPLYYLCLVVLLLLVPLVLTLPKLRPFSDIWFWLHASNFAITLYGWPQRQLSHFWSLALEEQYYLFWPFVIRFCNRTFVTLGGFALVVLGIFIRFNWNDFGSQSFILYTFPLTRLDGFIVGSLIAMWRGELVVLFRNPKITSVLLGALVLIPLCIAIYKPFSFHWKYWPTLGLTINFTLISIYFGVWLLLALAAQPNSRIYRFFSLDLLRHVGKYSYAMYVIHVPLDTLMLGLHWHPVYLSAPYRIPAMIPYIVVMTTVIYLMSRLSWWLFESRFLSLKRFVQY